MDAAPTPKKTLGDYTILGDLGSGGMGIVRLAQEKKTDKLVALKTLATNDAYLLATSVRGELAAKELTHRGIAKTLDIIEAGDLVHFVCEYVEGIDAGKVIASIIMTADPDLRLADLLKPSEEARFPKWNETGEADTDKATGAAGDMRDGLTPEARRFIRKVDYVRACCKLAMQAAQALHYAHARGVIHRDIKPGNIMIAKRFRAKLIDFGIARARGDTTLTRLDGPMGTLFYMSPEQIDGSSRGITVDHRTDIYSLGIVLYEALSLKHPHRSASLGETASQIVSKRMRPVSWLNDSVPEPLQAIVHQASALLPDDRYQTGNELADDLQRYLNDEPVTARPYRYRLNVREITAARPDGPFLAAVIYLFHTLLLSLLVPGVLISFQDGNDTRVKFINLVVLSGPAFIYLLLGIGILRGHIASLIISPIISMLTLAFLVITAIDAYVIKEFNPFMLSVLGLFTVMNFIVTIALLLPASRTWFRHGMTVRTRYRKPTLYSE